MMARKRVKAIKLNILQEQSAVKIQSLMKGWMARRKIAQQRNAVRLIESWFMALKVARKQRLVYSQMRNSAIMIQSCFRRNEARGKFLKMQSAAVKVQSFWRMVLQRRIFKKYVNSAITVQNVFRAKLEGRQQRQDYLLKRQSAIIIQSWWRKVQQRQDYLLKRQSAIIIQSWWRKVKAKRHYQDQRDAAIIIQKFARGMISRRYVMRTRTMVTRLQARCRGNLARRHFEQLKHDQEYREMLRREQERLEAERREVAATKITRHFTMVVERKRFVRKRTSAVVIQKFWRGYWHRKVVMERISEMAATYKMVKEIKQRLEEATASAKPEDCLAARTSSAIDYIFSIRDVAQLIRAVKTLELSTRLSLECCVKMTDTFPGGSPVTQLVSLMARCNRSEPHKEVVSTTLDILINVVRVSSAREHVASVVSLVGDLFQTMLVYRDSSAEIFCKCCALLQLLAVSPTMRSQLTTSQSKKKLTDYLSVVSKKKRMKDENQRRRSLQVPAPAPTSGRKPLRPTNTNLNTTSSVARPGLNTTVTIKPAAKSRKPSLELASCPPWFQDSRPRYHEDPVTAVTSLNTTLGLTV